eukprot:m.58031 g.58031  ORF g.58031 m.58031 type:complete len:369 (+) comp15638_c0_seq4:254-1360(+)
MEKSISAVPVCQLPFFQQFCKDLPKIELHRHLTGSMPRDAIKMILQAKAPHIARDALLETPVHDPSPAGQKEAWDLLVKQCHAVKIATEEDADLERLVAAAIQNLAEDNVMYCEFRVGLKQHPTKAAYLKTLMHILQQQREKHPGVTVRLLLSVARHGDVEQGQENVRLAIDAFQKSGVDGCVCGVELGGVTTAKHWRDFVPVFAHARGAGLPVALHCGEDTTRQAQWKEMIDWRPDRLGHCVYLDHDNMAALRASGIPVEIAPTCHELVFGVDCKDNIFGQLYTSRQVTVATDNPTFYNVSLSSEYAKIAQTYRLTIGNLVALARCSIDFAFTSPAARAHLRRDFDARVQRLARKYGVAITSVSARL